MAMAQMGTVLRDLRRLLDGQGADDLGDGELLRRFAGRRDEAAFAALVARHGPLVWGVCCRVLGGEQDAEDAFQATFLVLATQAATIRKAEAVAGWLHGVAHRLSLAAKKAAARRRRHERQAAEATGGRPRDPGGEPRRGQEGADDEEHPGGRQTAMQDDPLTEASRREALAVLDDELARLPAPYRAPLVLCYLQGKTNDEAARLLGCPSGTLKTRLSRGRELLRARLARRGLSLSAPALAAVLGQAQAVARPPAGLCAGAVRAALDFTARATVAGAAGARAVALVQGVLRTMTHGKLLLALFVTLIAGLLGVAAALYQAAAAQPAAQGPLKPRQPPGADAQGEPLPPGALVRLGSLRFRHSQPVSDVAFFRDGKTLATVGQDRVVRLWDVGSGTFLRRLDVKAPASPAGGHFFVVAFAPDGKTLASSDREGTIRLRDTATGRELGRLGDFKKGVAALTFSPDGKTLAAADPDGRIGFWDVAGRREVRHLNAPDPRSRYQGILGNPSTLRFSPDGKYLASITTDNNPQLGHRITFRLWELAGGKVLRKIDQSEGPPQWVAFAAFSPDSKRVAWSLVSGKVVVADTRTGAEQFELPVGRSGNARLVFAPNGDTLFTQASREGIRAWNVRTGKKERDFPKRTSEGRGGGHLEGSPAGMAICPAGRTLAVAGDGNRVRLIEVATGRDRLDDEGHRVGIESLSYRVDGKVVTSSSRDGVVRAWVVATGEPRPQPPPPANSAAHRFSPDGKTVASLGLDRTLRIVDTATGKARVEAKMGWDRYASLAFSADGSTLAFWGSNDGRIRLWHAPTGKELAAVRVRPREQIITDKTTPLEAPTLSANGRYLAWRGRDNAVHVWDVASGKERGRMPVARPTVIRASVLANDGRSLLALTGDGRIALWEVPTGKERCCFAEQFQVVPGPRRLTGPQVLALARDGGLVAAAGGDGKVRVWDGLTGKELARFEGHEGAVTALAFAPDGKTMASAGADTTALVWDLSALGRGKKAAPLSAKAAAAHWKALAGVSASEAYEAIAALAADPERAVPLLRKRLKPGRVDAREVEKLVAALDGNNFAARQKATDELRKLGELALPQLRKALAGQLTLEARRRLEELVSLATGEVPGGDDLRVWRAVEVLERIGTAEARQVLRRLAEAMPPTRRNAPACEALDRLGR
jgi:RNA polymerase sigma factor (sigma-70 family)